jgi:regulator of protease activity HflC (stomatin/prohibitin superfamily)
MEFVGSGAAVFGVVLYIIGGIGFGGLLVVQPNQAQVLILFGSYIGTVAQPGFWCCNPFAKRRKVSLRARNFQGEQLKVNDAAGNPIEIAAVVVWCVTDAAKAVFEVDDYEQFVTLQSEAALRELAGRYSYDGDEQGSRSLRSSADEVHQSLQVELQSRLDIAGIEVVETGLTHLAYAPEIAAMMLRRQQAEAIIAARTKLVQGVAALVQTAMAQLAESELIELDPERKAAMASSLMVVLSGDRTPTPVINTGSLYT